MFPPIRLAALGLAALLAALAFAAPAAAQTDDIEARAGDLRIIHLWSLEPEAFMQAWSGPTPPTLPMSTRTRRNVPIQQFILYANCQKDAAGNCHLSARVEIAAPDGTPYGEPLVFDALPPGPAAPSGAIGLAPGAIGLRVEDGEQLGTYRVTLSVTDRNAGVTAVSRISLEVEEAETQ